MSESDEQLPIWARDDAFPSAPGGWGWVDHRGRRHPCGSEEELAEALRARGTGVPLVWTPERAGMVVPEELESMAPAIADGLGRAARGDLREGSLRLVVAWAVAAWMAVDAWCRGGLDAVLVSGWVGLGLLLGVIFGAIPAYRGWKELRRLDRRQGLDSEDIAEARFESWLDLQRMPVTWFLLGLMGLVGILQLALHSEGWQLAGLLKERCRAGEWWRLATAPWLHGHPLHWLLNASALMYLGRRCEALAGWPHLAMVFLASCWFGGIASLRWVAAPSIGASGGLLGLLGFLLAFETLHRRLVPVSARRRLLAGLVITAVIGVLGFRFIDNAAHAGGLVAGLVYGIVVFPPSDSALQPRRLGRDLVGGGIALALLLAGAGLACLRIAG